MLVSGGWVLTVLVSWLHLSLQLTLTGAKVWKDKMKVPDFGQSTQFIDGKAVDQKSNSTFSASLRNHTVMKEHLEKEDRLQQLQHLQQQQEQQLQHNHHHTIQYTDDVLYTERDDSGWQNGALSLIISVLTEKIVQDMTMASVAEERLTMAQAQSLRHRLKGLYSYLKDHPALMERRLHVGSRKPHIPVLAPQLQVQKRDFDPFTLDIEQPVCPSRAEWRQLHKAKDINDTDVQVYQPPHGEDGMQWFYTVSCANAGFAWQRDCPGCCIGINHIRYASSCQPKKTFVMALVRKQPDLRFDWNWIQVDTSCNCAVKPLNPFDFG